MTLAIGMRSAILLLNGGRCRYCGGVADTVDHVVPICKGGTNAPSNLVAACGICNMSKNGSSLHPDTERKLINEAQANAEEAERLAGIFKLAQKAATKREKISVERKDLFRHVQRNAKDYSPC